MNLDPLLSKANEVTTNKNRGFLILHDVFDYNTERKKGCLGFGCSCRDGTTGCKGMRLWQSGRR